MTRSYLVRYDEEGSAPYFVQAASPKAAIAKVANRVIPSPYRWGGCVVVTTLQPGYGLTASFLRTRRYQVSTERVVQRISQMKVGDG